MRRFLASVVLTLVLPVLAAANATPAAAQTSSPAETSFRLPVTDGRANEQMIELDVTVFTPPTATAESPAPVIVHAHGFGGKKQDLFALAKRTAAAGYVSVAYSARGFGASSGGIGLDSVHYDVKDAKALISRIATLPGVLLDGPGDPRIGFGGDSYGGGISLMIAATDSRVDAIAPRITWSSLVYALSPNNLGLQPAPDDGPIGVYKAQWTSFFFAVGASQPVSSPEGAPITPSQCGGFVQDLCAAYAETTALGQATPATIDLLRESSPTTYARGLRVPTMLLQGQSDTLFNLNDSLRNLEILRANGAPTKLVWFNGGHSGANAPGEAAFLEAKTLRWWDRWLRQDRSVDTGPGFEWYRPWVRTTAETVADAYASDRDYPAYRPSALTLGSGGRLGTDAGPAGTVQLVNPPGGAPSAYSETSALEGRAVNQPPRDIPGQFAAWETEALDRPVELVGPPQLRGLRVRSLTGEAVLFAKLYDVGPDGSFELIRRMVAPVRATSLDRPLDITLPAMVHRFEAGHRLRVVLAATDAAYASRRVPDTYTITIGGPDAARLELPLSRPLGVAAAAVGSRPAPNERSRELPATGTTPLVLPLGLGLLVAGLLLRRRHTA